MPLYGPQGGQGSAGTEKKALTILRFSRLF